MLATIPHRQRAHAHDPAYRLAYMLSRLVAPDPEREAALFREHGGLLSYLVRRFRVPGRVGTEADDLRQEASVALVYASRNWPGDGRPFHSYASAVMRRHLSNVVKWWTRQGACRPYLDDTAAALNTPDPARLAEVWDLAHRLGTAAMLTEEERQALQLHYVEGMCLKEIARRLGQSRDYTRAVVRRALAAARALADECDPLTDDPKNRRILNALDGKGLQAHALVAEAGQGRRMVYRRLAELRSAGLVKKHPALGYYYRPDAPPPLNPPDPLAGLNSCQRDLLTVIERAGRRMSADEARLALREAGLPHGDSTVIKALASLCQQHGPLTNRRDSRGRGYGLPEWGDG
jgi:RNA polymerase sigma factor (sigma-70 family)